ncbi:alpha-amylase family protein [Shewanella sp. 1CM18E]|uniref:alpha-amylase family glycosyl hydrolase n=1 Tax=Shewanella sp. 1CM18E TaxID=2929169 RepID=UPI0020C03FE8|nr:alpha-amylase family glycosyl hydrolase [Shewanella sp. 1CM18E]MCK8044314.1 alpha-amylase family protein [Shewanella sp. 1CM18E]
MKYSPLITKILALGAALLLSPTSYASQPLAAEAGTTNEAAKRPVIYQVFTRVFSNQNTHNQPWGTVEQNGSGKFNDINDAALASIADLGVTHIWYTGILHHASVTDHSALGLKLDDPDVVKGRAGSPYAIRDYYNVNPDLAVNPAERLAEFTALVKRSQRHGLKVIIDLVPNHVARDYHSYSQPEGVKDFGENDDKTKAYAIDNNFYYATEKPFEVPLWRDDYQVLGGESHPAADGKFTEVPAKWTGNGSRNARPDMNDWYETVKLNYGVRLDGSYDFPSLPEHLRQASWQQHYAFWQGKKIPDTWVKFNQIAQYWLALGVDGFRFDVAELVPVEFWSYLNSSIKHSQSDAFLLAEVYQPELFRDYLQLGKMDYLYNKVDLYDSLKAVIRAEAKPDTLVETIERNLDIDAAMVNFLENHDEQRIAHPDFAGSAEKALPAMTVSATVGNGPVMLYFAQEVGEAALKDAGFGKASRTTIFDYWGLESMQGWINEGQFDGAGLSAKQQSLRSQYQQLLKASQHPALQGHYQDLHSTNLQQDNYDPQVFSFARWHGDARAVVLANFTDSSKTISVKLPASLIKTWQLAPGRYALKNLLSTQMQSQAQLTVGAGKAKISLTLPSYGSQILIMPAAQ